MKNLDMWDIEKRLRNTLRDLHLGSVDTKKLKRWGFKTSSAIDLTEVFKQDLSRTNPFGLVTLTNDGGETAYVLAVHMSHVTEKAKGEFNFRSVNSANFVVLELGHPEDIGDCISQIKEYRARYIRSRTEGIETKVVVSYPK